MTPPGKLLVIGTPIGNLQDLSPRALAALRRCAVLFCEDTRHTRRLLTHFGISRPLESLHEHNEREKVESIVHRILQGETVGMVSDAGMPQLSDPGFQLLRRMRELGLLVEPIPGPFAAALALVASGIAPVPFGFFGFAPHRKRERGEFYRRIAEHRMTAVVYESPRRLIASLEDALEALGDLEATVAREMTKLHEEFLHGRLSELLVQLRQRDSIPGEVTVVLAAPRAEREAAPDAETLRREFQRLRDSGLRRGDAIRLLGERFGLSRNELYRMLIE